MKLRYLHLPDYGVLQDVSVTFHSETLLPRDGAINFVVGLNGSGKSSLLRALYEVFVHLDLAELPRFPVTLVYEYHPRTSTKTVIFHHPNKGRSQAFFYVADGKLDERTHSDWLGWVEFLQNTEGLEKLVRGDQLQGNQIVSEFLPRPLLAYTSGATGPWQRIAESEMDENDLEALDFSNADEDRPRGWSVRRELQSPELSAEDKRREMLSNSLQLQLGNREPRCLLAHPEDIQLAAIALGLVTAAEEFTDIKEAAQMEPWRVRLLKELETKTRAKGARALLNPVDWWWPTHLILTCNADSKSLGEPQRAQFITLCALADEIVKLPRNPTRLSDQRQLVIPLGLGERRVVELLQGQFGKEAKLPVSVQEVASRVEASPNGAEAVTRVFSAKPKAAERLWEVFYTLVSWRAIGLLEHATVTVKRITPQKVEFGAMRRRIPLDLDDDLSGLRQDATLAWDDFSDGEQMLLGRMALLFLLRGQDDSLLLLDEPETHFNDVWKREIVDLVDNNVLKETAAQVLVATHTSIALTDVFSPEITVLRRTEDAHVEALQPHLPTFGEDPSEIMIRLFNSPDNMGQRASEFLDELIRRRWTDNDREKLVAIIEKIGAGYHRSELRAALKKLNDVTSS